ncbi:MAG: dTDP-4-dehydrorhamnose reductase [Alphaproteobacteria bacterium]|nr:dTDP-4-dehydrorhamnose reductase [Alphaproteobacteria bacterium]
MKVLVFGGAGQVGREVCRAAWPASFEPLFLGRSATDIRDAAMVGAVIAQNQPDLVINLAAYTAVDRAESEPEQAWAVNCAGAAHIAASCGDNGTPLVHLSTDYVFDGEKAEPYHEEDRVNPLNVYGASKEAGERAIRAAAPHHIILRTAWVYGAYGANFLKTMLRLGAERSVLRVVADQRGCPTAAADIASALVAITCQIERGTAQWGTFHFTAAGSTSWHGFAEEIVALAETFGAWSSGPVPRVEPITTDQYPTAARRPMQSVLDCRKIEGFGIVPPRWQSSLPAVLRELIRTKGP